MLFFVLIVLGLTVSCTLFAILGARLGSKMEEKNAGGGTVETSMREGMSANVLGGLIGIVPFLAFIIALVITVITNPAHPEEHDGSSSSESSH
jgi:amino acid transporter